MEADVAGNSSDLFATLCEDKRRHELHRSVECEVGAIDVVDVNEPHWDALRALGAFINGQYVPPEISTIIAAFSFHYDQLQTGVLRNIRIDIDGASRGGRCDEATNGGDDKT